MAAAAEAAVAKEPELAEDVDAHNLLRQCYARLAGDRPTDPPPASLTADEAAAAVATVTDGKQSREAKIQACDRLAAGAPRIPSPKLTTVRESIAKLGPAYDAEGDAGVKEAIAAALSVLHRESHAMYKPDEVAEANATQIYRAAHPEADYAARARVIYPTTAAHRDAIRQSPRRELPPGR